MEKMNDERCIEDLRTLQGFYRLMYGAEPSCLEYAIERIKYLNQFQELKVIGETRKE